MKKVLFITVRADFGGGPEHIFNLIKHLKNVEVYAAAPRDFPYWSRYAQLITEDRMFELPHRKFSVTHLRRLLRFAADNEIDILHSHGKGAGVYGRLASLLLRRPCVHTYHGLHIDQYNRLIRKLYIGFERFLTKYSHKVICVSKSEKERLLRLGIAPEEKIEVICNGVETSGPKVTHSQAANKTAVVHFTRFDYAKNTELVSDIAGYLEKDLKIEILGSGPGQEEIKQKLESKGLGNKIIFHGTTQNPRAFLENALCYLSTSRWEGMPLSVLEAMAAGVPVVATNVLGNTDAVAHEETGLLYELDKPEQAADHISRLRRDEKLWLKMSEIAHRRARDNYSLSEMAAKTEAVYETIGVSQRI